MAIEVIEIMYFIFVIINLDLVGCAPSFMFKVIVMHKLHGVIVNCCKVCTIFGKQANARVNV